ncbi:trehalose-phosphatase [Edaphobacter albus]|uniref:trehalose-phosphatase n=1 Tax=Edaphobacter sp. 4G125 TaxID=2763071 RepID=UPI0016496C13|nr:trehalose-phosphatase [Edaphobacter sp. 4G125]QNI35642.1 trehalose-phosphatase [Edaphobacter sp. 4G125]
MSKDFSVPAEFWEQLQLSEKSALLLDYDGTLAPFQIERDQAYPYIGVLPLLEDILRSKRTRMVVITGRPVPEAQALLSPLAGFEIWGAHGLDYLQLDGTIKKYTIAPELILLLEKAEQQLRTKELSDLLEAKPGGVAVHWRGLSEQEREKVRLETLTEWTALSETPGIKLLQFDGGLELRIAHPDKGDAIRAILEDLPNDVPTAFLGDDITDEDGFRALEDRGLPILVRDAYRSTNATAWIKPPEELLAFLTRWRDIVTHQK